MKRYSRRNDIQALADINIVPLVDLVFVLLIIFMLATPLLEQSLEIKVPSTESGAAVESQNVRTIAVDKAGRVFLDSKPIELPALRNAMMQLAAANPDAAVLVRTDRETRFDNFAKVVDILKQAQIKKMGMVTANEASRR